MKLANRQPSFMAALALVVALGTALTLGSCDKSPVIPEEPDQPGDPQDPEGTSFRLLGEGFYFV